LKARASIQAVTRVIKSAGVPSQITQQPFDHDPSHYRRLCDLGNNQPQAFDLLNYALDMRYMDLQPELLRHLTPVLLASWRKDLFDAGKAGYAGLVEQFWSALLKGKALSKVYSRKEIQAFSAYMRNTVLDRLDAEDSLRFSGRDGNAYRWVGAFVSYGVVFPEIEPLWEEWWQMKTPGHATSAFQYASALMYDDEKNAVFDAWTRDQGGGPPALWACDGMMFDVGWKMENLEFLKRTLSAEYIEKKLLLAIEQIESTTARKVASGIIGDFPSQRTRLELRIEELPTLLKDVSQVDGFTV
jgi:hypothetical protein